VLRGQRGDELSLWGCSSLPRRWMIFPFCQSSDMGR
jgi:hypothetical protein